jgi:alkylation response protein AidB-like acyl-CoA dehydrogenase
VNFDLEPEHELIRDTVRQFALDRVAPVAEELDREKRFPYEIVAELAELGLMGMTIPEEYGGAGADTLSYAIAVEELTRIDSSVAITVAAHHSLGTLPIWYFGTEEQKRRWLPELASGAKLAAFGLTEANAGSDAGATRTNARLEDGEWVVDGSKIFITNAGTDITACVTITAVTGNGEISNIVVPNGTAGYVISEPMQKLGWRASDTRELSFQGVRVPQENLLGERGQGFTQFLQILDGGRISVAAMGVGLAQGAYDLAYAYAKEREQFGKKIGTYQAVSHPLAATWMEVELGRSLSLFAAWCIAEDDERATVAAASAKALCADAAVSACERSIQAHGGIGFTWEHVLHRLYKRALWIQSWEASTAQLRSEVASYLLDGTGG